MSNTLTGLPADSKAPKQTLVCYDTSESGTQVLKSLSTDAAMENKTEKRKHEYLPIDSDHSYDGAQYVHDHRAPIARKDSVLIIDDYRSKQRLEIEHYTDSEVRTDSRIDKVVGSRSRTMVLPRL